MRIGDFLLGLLFIAGAVILAIAASSFPPIPGQKYGADVMPLLTAAGLACCGAIVTASTVRAGIRPLVSPTWVNEPGAGLRMGITVVLVVGYIVLAPRIGFIPTAALVLFGLFTMLKVRAALALPVAIAVALLVYFAFNNLLRVPLPRGLIEGLL